MREKCALSHGSGVLGRDPRDSCRFWSPHVENVCTVTQIRLGEGGGGGDTIGGGGVGEPRTGIIYKPYPYEALDPKFEIFSLNSLSTTLKKGTFKNYRVDCGEGWRRGRIHCSAPFSLLRLRPFLIWGFILFYLILKPGIIICVS